MWTLVPLFFSWKKPEDHILYGSTYIKYTEYKNLGRPKVESNSWFLNAVWAFWIREMGEVMKGMGFLFGVKCFKISLWWWVIQFCEYPKMHWMVYSKWVTWGYATSISDKLFKTAYMLFHLVFITFFKWQNHNDGENSIAARVWDWEERLHKCGVPDTWVCLPSKGALFFLSFLKDYRVNRNW